MPPSLWRSVYLPSGSSLDVPWYSVLGNHDYGNGDKGVAAQVARTTETDDDNWHMPEKNYTHTFPIKGGGTVKVVFIDTTTLAPSSNKCCNEAGGVSLEEQQSRIDNQLEWIERHLQQAQEENPSWLIVAGHYPIYSIGSHSDNAELVTHLQPLLEKYHVDAYFSGHDHISEHLKYNGIEYFVAGAASLTDKVGAIDSSAAELHWAGAGFSAFAAVAATPANLAVEYVNMKGETIYEYTFARAEPVPEYVEEDSNDGEDSNRLEAGLVEEEAEKSRMNAAALTTAGVFMLLSLVVVVGFVADARLVSDVASKAEPNCTLPGEAYLTPTTPRQPRTPTRVSPHARAMWARAGHRVRARISPLLSYFRSLPAGTSGGTAPLAVNLSDPSPDHSSHSAHSDNDRERLMANMEEKYVGV